MYFFFFSSRRRHTRLQGDWSSDVCSSDLCPEQLLVGFIADGEVENRIALVDAVAGNRVERERADRVGPVAGQVEAAEHDQELPGVAEAKDGRDRLPIERQRIGSAKSGASPGDGELEIEVEKKRHLQQIRVCVSLEARQPVLAHALEALLDRSPVAPYGEPKLTLAAHLPPLLVELLAIGPVDAV